MALIPEPTAIFHHCRQLDRVSGDCLSDVRLTEPQVLPRHGSSRAGQQMADGLPT